MSDRWHEYIRGGLDLAGGPMPFALLKWDYMQPVVNRIRSLIPPGGRILEVGCGSAILPALLAHFGYSVTAVDDDDRIVEIGREMVEYFHSPVTVDQADARDLAPYHDRFDLAYSLGVVEHFDKPVTVSLIAEQARCAPIVVTAVPSKHTHFSGPITDERIYSRRQFVRLVRQAGLEPTESFVYGTLPTWTATQMNRALPKVLNRPFQYLFTYGMGICVVGRRPDGTDVLSAE